MTIEEFLKFIKVKGTNSAFDIDKNTCVFCIWVDKFGIINPTTAIPYPDTKSVEYCTEKQLLSSEFKDCNIIKTEFYIPNTEKDVKDRPQLTILFIIDHDKYIRTRLSIMDKERYELVQKLEFKSVPKKDEEETTEVLKFDDSIIVYPNKTVNIFEDNYNDGRS